MSTYVKSSIYFSGNAIARRHGALNIGGNLCQIGTEAFEGFIGVIDEVMNIDLNLTNIKCDKMFLYAGSVCLFMGILPIINGQLSLLQTLKK